MNHESLAPIETSPRLPLWLKITYTAFMAVLIPVYWANYGPTNFLYFCDVALLLTLVGVWKESALLVSMPAVGILLPQLLWCADFAVTACGGNLAGMTGYMFDARNPLFLRGLSFFHGWLPFLLLFLVAKLGYDGRALRVWTALAFALCLIAFFALPPAGALLADSKLPRNVNYVFGFNDAAAQSWMPAPAYLFVWMGLLLGVVYVPTHVCLKKFISPATHE